MQLETCFDCGAIYDVELQMYEGISYHMDWHYRLDQKVSALEEDLEYLQRSVAEIYVEIGKLDG